MKRSKFFGQEYETMIPRELLIPKGAQKVSDKHSDALAYIYRNGDAPCAMVFYGNQSKPIARFRYRDEAERETDIKKWFAGRQRHAAQKAENEAERKTAIASVKFEVGKTYYDRAASDYDTIYSFKIVDRTEKTLTIEEHGKTKKRGIYVYKGVECCKPHGTYSMCSVIKADDKPLK